MTLYIFITHQKNFENCYPRIKEMMQEDFIVVSGGYISDSFDEENRVLKLNCNDVYAGLPEKVLKSFHFVLSDDRFTKYDYFCKLDDDMKVIKRFESLEGDYLGNVHYVDGNRNWHRGRCGNFWDQIPYIGEFVPWCMGGFGYVVSRNALSKCLPNFDYINHIYEDVYIGLLLKSKNIDPINTDIKNYLVSPDH
jgi:hypothetical protein